MERQYVGVGDATAAALIGARRIDEAIAQDPRTAVDRGADGAGDMVGARGGKEQGLAPRIPTVVIPFHKQRADRLGARATARFACRDDLDSALRKRGSESMNLGRLADPFPALERDEPPAHQPVNR